MGNVFPSDVVLHRRYDLKGSRHGRTAGAEALAKPNAVLKDLDVDLALALEPRTHAELTRALRADAAFLERLGLIDYSLLLGVHFGGWAPGCWRPPGSAAGSEAPLPPVRLQQQVGVQKRGGGGGGLGRGDGRRRSGGNGNGNGGISSSSVCRRRPPSPPLPLTLPRRATPTSPRRPEAAEATAAGARGPRAWRSTS